MLIEIMYCQYLTFATGVWLSKPILMKNVPYKS